MEDQAGKAFDFSDFRIQDGFKFGDWRDQWIIDKSFDELFSARKNLFENQDFKGKLLHIFNSIIHECTSSSHMLYTIWHPLLVYVQFWTISYLGTISRSYFFTITFMHVLESLFLLLSE